MIAIEDLQDELTELNKGLRDLRKDLARNYAPRRELIRQRRRAAFLLLAVLVMLAAGGWVTQQATLAREHRIVAECFLLPSRLDPAKVRDCSQTFPGYGQVQQQSARNLKVFVDLQARVAKLEAAQKK